MIVDITSEVIDILKRNLTGVTVLSAYPSTTPSFPCVIVQEILNDTNTETIDSSGEKYNDVAIEVNIYSNSPTRVTEVKNIRIAVDAIMSGQLHMNRGSSGVTPNYMDSNIHRYTMRYNFTIGSNKVIYRR